LDEVVVALVELWAITAAPSLREDRAVRSGVTALWRMPGWLLTKMMAGLVVAMSWPWFLFTMLVFAQGSDISVFLLFSGSRPIAGHACEPPGGRLIIVAYI
jgi:hypothetical protein